MSENTVELMQLFSCTERLLNRYIYQANKKRPPGSNPMHGQGRILSLLKLQPEITQKELGYLLGIRPQSLGELLVKLETAGFISRSQLEDDKRVMVITLTEEGAEAANNQAQPEQDAEDVFSCLDAEQQGSLREMLATLIENLEARTESMDQGGYDGECRWNGAGPNRGHGPNFEEHRHQHGDMQGRRPRHSCDHSMKQNHHRNGGR